METAAVMEEAPVAVTVQAVEQDQETVAPEDDLQEAAPPDDDAQIADLDSALIFDDELEEDFDEDTEEDDDFVSDLGMEIEDENGEGDEFDQETPEAFQAAPAAEEPTAAEAPVESSAPWESPEAAAEPTQEAGLVSGISDERIEAAVAKIMEEKFSERIESLMVDAVEKAVEKELAKIKSLLLDTGSNSSDD